MKIFPYYTHNPLFTIDQIYNFFETTQIESFIVELYKFKPMDSLETIAVNLLQEYNGYKLVLLIDYENGDDLYTIHIETKDRSIQINSDIVSIKKAVHDMIKGTV